MGLKEIWAHKFRSFLTMLGIILGVASAAHHVRAHRRHGARDARIHEADRRHRAVDVIRQDVPEEQSSYRRDLAGPDRGRRRDHPARARRSSRYVSPVSELSAAAPSREAIRLSAPTVYGCWPDFVPHQQARHRHRTQPLASSTSTRPAASASSARLVVEKLWPERPNYNAVGEILLDQRPPVHHRRHLRLLRARGGQAPPRARQSQPKARTLAGAAALASEPASRRRLGSFRPQKHERASSRSPRCFTSSSPRMSSAAWIRGRTTNSTGSSSKSSDVARFQDAIEQVAQRCSTTHRGIEDFAFDTREEWFDTIERSISKHAHQRRPHRRHLACSSAASASRTSCSPRITERIREIGVRRAIGAKGRDIFIQIVVESSVIGVIGGVLGLGAPRGSCSSSPLSPRRKRPRRRAWRRPHQLRLRRRHRRPQRPLPGVQRQPPRSDRGAALRLISF